MSTQPRVQQFPTASGDRFEESRQDPGVGERPRVTEEKIIKTTRFEVGFFVRKVVDGQVVRQWQFPPKKRRPVAAVAPPPVPQADSGGGAEQADAAEQAPQVRSLALEAAAPGDAGSSDGSSDRSNDKSGGGSSTTYEVGVFVRTETVTPPDYDPDPNPKDQPPSV